MRSGLWARVQSATFASSRACDIEIHERVSDIEAARGELLGIGVEASEVFHDAARGSNCFAPNPAAI